MIELTLETKSHWTKKGKNGCWLAYVAFEDGLQFCEIVGQNEGEANRLAEQICLAQKALPVLQQLCDYVTSTEYAFAAQNIAAGVLLEKVKTLSKPSAARA